MCLWIYEWKEEMVGMTDSGEGKPCLPTWRQDFWFALREKIGNGQWLLVEDFWELFGSFQKASKKLSGGLWGPLWKDGPFI